MTVPRYFIFITLLGKALLYANNACSPNTTVSAANTSERVTHHTNLQNYTYQLCSNVNVRSGDTVLGHDFILYLRPPTEHVKLDVFFLRTVNATPPWEELVANRSIPINASGWQVLNLKSEVDPFVQSIACVDMYVRETDANDQRTLLNQTQIAERFVLNDCAPDETANLPFVATYMFGGISLPIFGKRSVGASHPNQCSRDTNCSLQYRRVDLNDYLPPDIIYPHQADLGQCGGIIQHFPANSHHQQYLAMDRQEKQEEKQESAVGEDSSQESLYQCIPNNYRDLLVLRSVAFELVLELIPDFVITGCTLQSCGSEI